MVSKSALWCGDPGSFSEVMNLPINYFEGSKEWIIGREAERRSSMVKYGEVPLAGGAAACEIPVRFPMNDGAMESVPYMWVNIWCMLDWIIEEENNLSVWFFFNHSLNTKGTVI